MQLVSTYSTARNLAALVVASVTLSACGEASGREPDPGSRTTYGQRVAVGKGTARTYLITQGGVPTEVGVALTEGALDDLPTEHASGGVHAHGHTTFETVLQLPLAHGTAFRHVLMNWNPGGHEPPGIYDSPHFDFHFYVIDQAEREAIDPADPEYQRKAERTPPPEVIPERYILPAPLAFARMGVHWVDTTSAELKGQPFTTTFIYGSWDGKLIFAEPMITKAFLQTKPQFNADLPAPRRQQMGGLYPRGYRVRWDEGSREYRISLTGLEPRG